MSLELDTLYSEEVDEGEHLTLDFEGRIIHVSVGKSAITSSRSRSYF